MIEKDKAESIRLATILSLSVLDNERDRPDIPERDDVNNFEAGGDRKKDNRLNKDRVVNLLL